MIVYTVIGATGLYDAYTETTIVAYSTREVAEAHVAAATKWYAEKWDDGEDDADDEYAEKFVAECPYCSIDPSWGGGIRFWVEELELRDALPEA